MLDVCGSAGLTHQKKVEIVALRRSAPRNSGAWLVQLRPSVNLFRRYYAAVGCRSATTATNCEIIVAVKDASALTKD